MRLGSAYVLCSAIVLTLAGCKYLPGGNTPIQEILHDPVKFEGKEVKVRGKASDANKIPFLNIKTYMLKDDSGGLLVVTSGELPSPGQDVAIRGRIDSALILSGKSFGLTLHEIEKLPTF